MAFEGLSEKLQGAFKDLKGQGVVSEKDFETQRKVFKLLRDKLEREMEPERKCDNCGWISENGLYEGGGESPCCYCDNHELWIAEEEADAKSKEN